jgi:hypothetical protein
MYWMSISLYSNTVPVMFQVRKMAANGTQSHILYVQAAAVVRL